MACSGAMLGLVLARWTGGFLPSLLSPEGAEMLDTSLDAATIAGTILVAVIAGALFAIGPAHLVTRTLDVEALRADAGAVSSGRGRAAAAYGSRDRAGRALNHAADRSGRAACTRCLLR